MADHLFFSEVGEGSVERTVLIMLWHIKEANQLIQAKVGRILQIKERECLDLNLPTQQ